MHSFSILLYIYHIHLLSDGDLCNIGSQVTHIHLIVIYSDRVDSDHFYLLGKSMLLSL